jgi:ubiquinone/menaquinone biosynthesis C-methylase UbiE
MKGFSLKKELWNYLFQYYSEQTNPIYAERYLRIKIVDWRLTMMNKGDLILDVGSGKPIDAIRAIWLGARFIALDLSAQELRKGKEFIKRELNHLRPLADFVVADATTLPFRNDVFDVVVSYSAIEHVPAKEKQHEWIKEMARVTKVGGKTVVTTSNRLNFICFLFHPFRIIDYSCLRPRLLAVPASFVLFWLSQRFKLFEKYVPLRNDYFECFFTPRNLKELLMKVGLKPKIFDSSTLYYWGYAPPLLAFSSLALKIDYFVNKLEDVKCLKTSGVWMGFNSVKT